MSRKATGRGFRDFSAKDFALQVNQVPLVCSEVGRRLGDFRFPWENASGQLPQLKSPPAKHRPGRRVASQLGTTGTAPFPAFLFSPSPSVLLLGEGSSFHSAKLLAQLLCNCGLRAKAESADEWLGQQARETQAREPVDLVIGLSHSGKTKTTQLALSLAHESPKEFRYLLWLTGAEGVKHPLSADHSTRFVHWKLGRQEVIEPHTHALLGPAVALGGRVGLDCLALCKRLDSRVLWSPLERRSARAFTKAMSGLPWVVIGSGVDYWLGREFALKACELLGVGVTCYTTEEYFHGPFRYRAPHALVALSVASHPRFKDLEAEMRPMPSGVLRRRPAGYPVFSLDLRSLTDSSKPGNSGSRPLSARGEAKETSAIATWDPFLRLCKLQQFLVEVSSQSALDGLSS